MNFQMQKKPLIISLCILAIVIVLGGYGISTVVNNESTGQSDHVKISHELGVTELAATPKKVVVFDYGLLDTLDGLNITIQGVSKANLPNYLAKYKGDAYSDIGGLKEPNFEVLAKLKPDVILISGRQKDSYESLKEIAPTIYFTIDNNNYYSSFVKNMHTIGTIFQKDKVVNELLEPLSQKIETLKAQNSKSGKTGLIVLTSNTELKAYGPASRFGIIHNTLGVVAIDENIEVATHGQAINYEYIVQKNPDYLFVIDRDTAIGEKGTPSLFENDIMKRTTAYQQKQIISLDPQMWYLSSGGLQSTKAMVNEIEQSMKG